MGSGTSTKVLRPCTCICWTSWGSPEPIAQACLGPSEWQPIPQACQMHLTAWCHLLCSALMAPHLECCIQTNAMDMQQGAWIAVLSLPYVTSYQMKIQIHSTPWTSDYINTVPNTVKTYWHGGKKKKERKYSNFYKACHSGKIISPWECKHNCKLIIISFPLFLFSSIVFFRCHLIGYKLLGYF